MNINNVVLVRVMNNIPLNGELIPSSEGKRLVRDNKSDFYYYIRDCVKKYLEEKLGRNLDLYINSNDYNLLEGILKEYNILTGDYYTSTLSFSLNGLVPNDINNCFVNMKVAVLEPIKNQVDADYVTVETIDTTIKGKIKVSSEAILLIEENFLNNLSLYDKENLKNNFKVKVFNGNLKIAINNTLIENGYPVLPLIQKRELKNIEECIEKESMLEFEDKFSKMVGASRKRLQYLTLMYSEGDNIDKIAHDKISDEYDNTLIVLDYYKKMLYEFILDKALSFGIQIKDEDRYFLFTDYQEGIDSMKRIVGLLINVYGGIDYFKDFIKEYNNYVEDNYLTNKEIVSLYKNKELNSSL